MKNSKKIFFLALVAASMVFESCIKDLDRVPVYDVTSATVYNDPANYKAILAKIYAGMAVSGQQGPAGKPDISGIDEGFSTYLRQYYKAQELTTDEAVIGWNDGSIKDYHNMKWSSANEFIAAMYYRIFYQITLCNEFIRETTDAKLTERGLSGDANIKAYRAEARFMRALSYWHALDMFGNPPFVTEADPLGAFLPKQTTRPELFSYIEKELKEVETLLPAAKANEFGRADQAAAWTLLAKLYLNAEVYTGTSRATDCITYCNKVIGAGYQLETKYENLFKIGNDASKEVIFAVRFDGLRTKTWGGMTFLVHAPVGGTMRAADFGINGGWGGLRTTKEFVGLFNNAQSKVDTNDTRAMFYTDGQTLEIDDISEFKQGYAITKYKNVDQTGKAGSDPEGNFPDTDFPMFRLADVHLMYAEAVLRGGTGGTTAQALTYINALRQRAYKTTRTALTAITLDDVLNERGRELYWEMHRRTDLIRFKKFTTGTYLWSWKGGTKTGTSVSDNLNIFPIPAADVIANPNLKQNTGY
ncbi:MAG: RagB/SusD family nutrient uptake outer membrane protein [Saprospiraceae bacterium]|nr:RagB/SusD family nutrient uptake outer membrane protein [Saprospiraceae bacterium]